MRGASLALAALAYISTAAFAQSAVPRAVAPATDQTQWFREAKYGMFIHWGLYSKPAGEWKGKTFWGISEWIMNRERIPRAEYAKLAESFNPTAFDAKAWVAFAKAAGFKYIVVTSKHHDGFAMFRSKASPYNIVDATPFKRDPLKELANEAKRQGIRLGFYYSQYQDWNEPDAAGNDWDFPKEGRTFVKYQKGKAEPQIEELMTGYGDVAVLWFDTPRDITREAAEAFYSKVKTFQPKALVSSRVGHGLGDYEDYRDSEIPEKPTTRRPWEALFTVGESWGYAKYDHDPKSPTEIVRTLATVAGRGGNMILNIGPDGEGRLPEPMASPMRDAGVWLAANGDSIYATGASPFGPMPWGTATTKPGTLFVHVFERPSDGKLVLPDVKIDATSASLAGKAVAYRRVGTDVVIDLPAAMPDARDSVVTLAHRGPVSATQHAAILSRTSGMVELNPFLATLRGGLAAKRERYMTYFGSWKYFPTLDGLKGTGDIATWEVRVLHPGRYLFTLDYVASAAQAGREGHIESGGQAMPFRVLKTGDLTESGPPPYVSQRIGSIEFKTAGVHRIQLRPLTNGDAGMFTFKALHVTPHD